MGIYKIKNLIYPRLGFNKHKPNGDIFFRSSLIFFEISAVNTLTAVDNRMVTTAVVIIIIISLVSNKFLDWKSSIHFLY